MTTKIFLLLIALLGNFCLLFAQGPKPYEKFDQVKKEMIYSKHLSEDREIYVYAPESNNREKLPVIYILDGDVCDLYEEALDFSKIVPHIIVGISTIKNRDENFIPCKSSNSDNFLNYLLHEVKPFVNTNYKTNDENILFGISNGGLFTLHAFLTTAQSFSSYIITNPTIGHCSDHLNKLVSQFSDFDQMKNKHLYFSYGLKDPSTRVINYCPAFSKSLQNMFRTYMDIEVDELENEGHIPKESIYPGLKFIYELD